MKTALSLGIIGKLTFAPTDPPRPLGTYIIQRVPPGTGNVTGSPDRSLQIRRHVVGIDPNTEAQQANRSKFATAVIVWHTLSQADKQAWAKKGQDRRMSGFNAFVSNALKTA